MRLHAAARCCLVCWLNLNHCSQSLPSKCPPTHSFSTPQGSCPQWKLLVGQFSSHCFSLLIVPPVGCSHSNVPAHTQPSEGVCISREEVRSIPSIFPPPGNVISSSCRALMHLFRELFWEIGSVKIESDNIAIKENFTLLLLQTHWLPGTRV